MGILLAAGCWALIGPMSQLAGDPPIEIAFWRALFGGSCFLAYGLVFSRQQLTLALRNRTRRQHIYTCLSLMGFSLYGVVAYYWSYQVAISNIGIGLASVLLYTAPFWVAAIDLVRSRRKATARIQSLQLAAGAMCVLGVIVIALPSLDDVSLTTIGLVAGLVSGLCYASYYFLPYLIAGPIPNAFVFGIGMLLGAAALSPAARLDKSIDTWFWLFLIGVVSTFIAYTLLMYANRRLGATLTASIATMEPVFAASLGILFFGEILLWTQWAGFVMVLFAAVFAAIARQYSQQPRYSRHTSGLLGTGLVNNPGKNDHDT